MQLDPKYFNVFLGIVALVAASLIAFFMLSNRSSEKSAFKQQIFAQDTLSTQYWQNIQDDDSVRIADFKGRFVVVDFWSDWSNASLQSHRRLEQLHRHYTDSLKVLAASVGIKKEGITDYIKKNKFPFHFVVGSQLFSALNVPGLPAQLIYDPSGSLRSVFLGYPDDSQYDSLRSLMRSEYGK